METTRKFPYLLTRDIPLPL
jgi:hypothetical protein